MEQAQSWRGIPDTMTTRSAALVTIGLIAALMVGVAIAAMFAGDISERTGTIVTSVLGSLATVLAGLLLFLRVETVNSKVDDAAERASIAAQKAAAAEQKLDRVHHDVLNGPLRENVKKAIVEAETDPEIVEHRIEITAKGVSKDRHDKANRDAARQAREQLEARRARKPSEDQP